MVQKTLFIGQQFSTIGQQLFFLVKKDPKWSKKLYLSVNNSQQLANNFFKSDANIYQKKGEMQIFAPHKRINLHFWLFSPQI